MKNIYDQLYIEIGDRTFRQIVNQVDLHVRVKLIKQVHGQVDDQVEGQVQALVEPEVCENLR